MLSLKERFELLEADLLAEPPRFIMSRDLPFAIFPTTRGSRPKTSGKSERKLHCSPLGWPTSDVRQSN